jgi:hypothetical protein
MSRASNITVAGAHTHSQRSGVLNPRGQLSLWMSLSTQERTAPLDSRGTGAPSGRTTRFGRSRCVRLATREAAKRPNRVVRKRGLEPPRYCYRQPLKLKPATVDQSRPRTIGIGCLLSFLTGVARSHLRPSGLQILARVVREFTTAAAARRSLWKHGVDWRARGRGHAQSSIDESAPPPAASISRWPRSACPA